MYWALIVVILSTSNGEFKKVEWPYEFKSEELCEEAGYQISLRVLRHPSSTIYGWSCTKKRKFFSDWIKED